MKLFRALRASTFATVLSVILIGMVASTLAALQVSRIARAKDRERFDGAVSQGQDSIGGRLETYIAMLRAGAGMVAASNGAVDRAEFSRFASQLELPTHYPGVQGIGFSARLPLKDPQRALSAFGAPDLKLYPPGSRDELHAIVHLEPLDRRNVAALGYDMFSEPVRRAAMERARDTGLPAASGRVQLVQEIDETKQAGFLIYVPVYRGGEVPAALADRREKLLGFVYSPFRMDDLLAGTFPNTSQPRLGIEIYDGEVSPQNLLHRSERGDWTPRYVSTRMFNVAGRKWTIQYRTGPLFEASLNQNLAPYVFFGGVLATLCIAMLTAAEARARRRADQAACALQVNSRQLEVLHDAAARLSAQLDADRLVQDITDAGRELSGAEIGAFFYNVINGSGESYLLFTLSGAPREAFEHLGMPRNTQVFGPTFRGEGPLRADDITKDPRFGKNQPVNGFPRGHWPVRSYLAVPVISRSGEALGGLFFGHSQIGVFTERSERSIVTLAGHAAIAIDNARLFKSSQQEIAARKKIEEHQKLLLDELNHRVKNTLAMVQSIAAQTLRTAPDAESFRKSFEARLIALSEAHNLLSRTNWRGASLHDLVTRELAPHEAESAMRVITSGDSVWLSPKAAVAIGMSIHELATNAVRHGSLSVPNGRVEVRWTTSATPTGQLLRLTWQESGGPSVDEPSRRGFGSRLLERGLKHDLQGEAKLHFDPNGLRCTIEVLLETELAAA